jgi:hypothetical protein
VGPATEENEGDREVSAHVYYATQRPPMMGAIPRGDLLYLDPYKARRYVPSIDRMAWGCVVYSRRLSPQEIADYELVAEPEVRNG